MTRKVRSSAFVLVTAALGAAVIVAVVNRDEDGPAPRVTTHEIHGADGILKERREVMERADGTVVAHGFRVLYYPDGEKRMEMEYKEGKQIGRATFWHKNGQKSLEGKYLDGKRHGKIVTWHPNGKKASAGTYAEGVPNGILTTWLEDGAKFEEGEYQEGKRHGTMKLYGEDGMVTRVLYEEGKIVR